MYRPMLAPRSSGGFAAAGMGGATPPRVGSSGPLSPGGHDVLVGTSSPGGRDPSPSDPIGAFLFSAKRRRLRGAYTGSDPGKSTSSRLQAAEARIVRAGVAGRALLAAVATGEAGIRR